MALLSVTKRFMDIAKRPCKLCDETRVYISDKGLRKLFWNKIPVPSNLFQSKSLVDFIKVPITEKFKKRMRS